ncbi:MAG: hypothetical protein RIE77_10755 [Phycisphaerales bacterium]
MQLKRSCAAMRAWDGSIDVPTNTVFVLARDRQNLDLLDQHRDLGLEVLGRVMDGHLQVPMVRDAARSIAHENRHAILGYVPFGLPVQGTAAVLIRELTARFVEAGVASCA